MKVTTITCDVCGRNIPGEQPIATLSSREDDLKVANAATVEKDDTVGTGTAPGKIEAFLLYASVYDVCDDCLRKILK